MAKFLVQTTEVYRVDTEGEVAKAIEEAKHDPKFTLSKYQSEKKVIKSKGEVVDEFYKVQFNKSFNNIKEPDSDIIVEYRKDV